MNDHDEASFFVATKDLMSLRISQEPHGQDIVHADSREDERQLPPSDSFSVSREEEPVHLFPRLDPSFDASENDHFSVQAAWTSSSLGSATREFLRESSLLPPSLPEIEELSSNKREKPSLCRSLAWSQDSLDEMRITKRCRREESSPTSVNEAFCFSRYQQAAHLQQQDQRITGAGPTAIHWEEKIVDSMQLISFVDPSVTFSNASGMQSAFNNPF